MHTIILSLLRPIYVVIYCCNNASPAVLHSIVSYICGSYSVVFQDMIDKAAAASSTTPAAAAYAI